MTRGRRLHRTRGNGFLEQDQSKIKQGVRSKTYDVGRIIVAREVPHCPLSADYCFLEFFQPNRFMSIFPCRKTTPSSSSSRRCSAPLSPGREIFPCALTTRCHGMSAPGGMLCKAYPAIRGWFGYPLNRDIVPYAATFPLGIRATVRQIRTYETRRRLPTTVVIRFRRTVKCTDRQNCVQCLSRETVCREYERTCDVIRITQYMS